MALFGNGYRAASGIPTTTGHNHADTGASAPVGGRKSNPASAGRDGDNRGAVLFPGAEEAVFLSV